MERLQQRLDELRGAGIDALLVDITGNGGGSEWCEDVAQLFSPKKLRHTPLKFVKHDHWAREIEREIERIDDDLAKEGLPAALREMLAEVRATHAELLEDIRAGCKVSDCERLAADEHGRYEIPPGAQEQAATLRSREILFRPSRHPDFVGLYDGPLMVAIDGGTASASEQFATLLQFNERATIVGDRSYGAGCGYTRGGIRLYLESVGLLVRMPDCMRVRADGENELGGIEPDVAGWDASDTGKTRARKLATVLARLGG